MKKLYDNVIKWFNNILIFFLLKRSPLLTWIDKMFKHSEKNEWFETYWAFDIHGVISKPDYRKKEKSIHYFPYVKKTLQLLSKRDDIIMFLFTSSYPNEVNTYVETFEKDDIHFNYVNENPEISSKKGHFGYYKNKPYYNVLFEDKSGFKSSEWKFIYKYFKRTKYRPDTEWVKKYTEDYHEK